MKCALARKGFAYLDDCKRTKHHRDSICRWRHKPLAGARTGGPSTRYFYEDSFPGRCSHGCPIFSPDQRNQGTLMKKFASGLFVSRRFVTISVAILAVYFAHPGTVLAQGCVAAHSPQPIVSGLAPNGQQSIADRLHGRLTVTIGYRFYNSYKHYIGTVYQAQRAAAHNAVVNHVNLFDIDVNYQLSPRWSLIPNV